MWWRAHETDKTMRTELLEQVRIAGQAINIERVSSLSGSKEDLDSHDYRQLKAQLANMRQARHQIRFLYLMGQHSDDTVFFFVDSLPEDSEDHAPPGLVYKEVPDSYLLAFSNKSQAVVGPITDRWGTLITALFPVIDTRKGELVAMLGMDVDASGWNREVFERCIMPFVITVLFAFLIIAWASREHEVKVRRESENRLRIAGTTAYDLIYERDVETDVLKWFGDIDGALGYESGQIQNNIENWVNIIHPDDRPRLEDAIELHRTSTNQISYEYRIQHKDESWRYWSDRALPLLNDKGRPYKWIGVCTDVTDSKRAEEEREELIGKLRDALYNIKTLKGMLPICGNCKKVRDDSGYWNQIEKYIESHSDALFSHGLCPECMDEIYGEKDWYKKKRDKR